ncbi:hypothetical protein KVT40_004832 [Elsinoe batatas]|uniref:Uncharacterized protein n=1 Tax=Elsinoe batatas TaxID=2601811 RepID=A0A8K0L0C7_9PEZI|nr:hypothetical protein KVT40_004832 [Elsinoe batatas]
MDHFLMTTTRTHDFGMCLNRRPTSARYSHSSTTINTSLASEHLSSEPRVHTQHIHSHISPWIYFGPVSSTSLSAFTRHSSQRLLHDITPLGSTRSPPSVGSAKPSRDETGFYTPSRSVKLGTAQRECIFSGEVQRMVSARYHSGIISVQQHSAPVSKSHAHLSLCHMSVGIHHIFINMHYIPCNDRQERFLFTNDLRSERASEQAGI